MPAFQDFNHLSERRKAEKQRKLRKRLTVAGIASLVLVLLLLAGVYAVFGYIKPTGKSKDELNSEKSHISTSMKAIKSLCKPTDYKETCESSLSKILDNTTNPGPKQLMKAAIQVVKNEVDKAMNHSLKLSSGNATLEQKAISDCRELLDFALDDLETTFGEIDMHGVEKITHRADSIKNWLSAVISYQQTCIDGIPAGKSQSDMEKGLKTAKELTSNALAIVTEVSSLLSKLDIHIPGIVGRRLLEEEDGFPRWFSGAERRLLAKKNLKKIKPNVVVAKDGSGDFKTINDALTGLPKEYRGRYVIYVKEGIYEENVIVTKKMVNITMYGDGSRKSIITGSKNYVDGTPTFQTATFAAIGDGFIARALGFRNTAGPEKHQAVALRVQSDRSIFLNCRMEGYQDTLYAQTHRQFYRSCVISGTVDFIFGDAAAVFQNCQIIVRKPMANQQNIITAQGRTDKRETTGIVIQNCKILPDKKLVPERLKIKSYLGRPWKEYSRTIFMESIIGDFIQPQGWLPWEGDFALKTLFYGEYNNRGPGAVLTNRVTWPGYKLITQSEAQKFTIDAFIQGGEWLKGTDTPYKSGFTH